MPVWHVGTGIGFVAWCFVLLSAVFSLHFDATIFDDAIWHDLSRACDVWTAAKSTRHDADGVDEHDSTGKRTRPPTPSHEPVAVSPSTAIRKWLASSGPSK